MPKNILNIFLGYKFFSVIFGMCGLYVTLSGFDIPFPDTLVILTYLTIIMDLSVDLEGVCRE